MIGATLEKLGFTKNEIRVYNAILKARRATPAEIAEKTKVSRPTVYSVAKALASKGLIAEDLGGKTLYLVPAGPEELGCLIKKEQQALKEKEKLMEQVRGELSRAAVGAEYPVPKIRFVEEQNLEEHLRARVHTWHTSTMQSGGTWWGFQDHSLVEHYREWIDLFWKKMPSGGHLKLLSNQSDIERRLQGKYKGREIKFWGKSEQFTATTWIAGDYVIMVRTDVHPFYLVELHDTALAHNLREVFKNLWDTI
jgi:sugar-specific transcriptional regulator TrmB